MKRTRGRPIAWVVLVVLVGLFALAGCGDDNGPIATSSVTPPETQPAYNPGAEFVQAASSSDSAEPGSEAPVEFDALLAEIQQESATQDSIAADLSSIDSSWTITGADVAEFVSTACSVDAQQAADGLLATIPGADLRAVPSLTQLLVLTVQDEQCGIPEPAVVDDLTNYLNQNLVANQRQRDATVEQIQAATPKPSSVLSTIYAGICETAGEGVSGWVKKKFKSGGLGGFAFMLTMGAVVEVCPGFIESMLG